MASSQSMNSPSSQIFFCLSTIASRPSSQAQRWNLVGRRSRCQGDGRGAPTFSPQAGRLSQGLAVPRRASRRPRLARGDAAPGVLAPGLEWSERPEAPRESSPMCPHCGREAPIVYRGVVPYCTACGALRAPLSTPSINLAGKSVADGGDASPAWPGGSCCSSASRSRSGFGAPPLGSVLRGRRRSRWPCPFALIATVIGALLLRGGSSLRQSGADAERATRDQALLSMAAPPRAGHGGGRRACCST